MKKITFICPYFGKLPESQMKVWLKSCKYNPSIDWIIFTDDKTVYKYPKNVHVIYTNLKEIKNRAQALFDFEISLDNPYKLCDYKPLYGIMFKDYLTKSDYWGHCDLSDSLYGNLRKFFTDEILDNYDKFMYLGHMTLYRNNHEVNNRFRIKTQSNLKLQDIFGTNENMAFDELKPYSINRIYIENNFRMIRMDKLYKDLTCLRYPFVASTYDNNFDINKQYKIPRIFLWKDGSLFDIVKQNGIIETDELAYIHYQKRKMTNFISEETNEFYILPNGFYEISDSLDEILKKNSRDKIIYYPFFKYKFRSLKYRLRKIKEKIL